MKKRFSEDQIIGFDDWQDSVREFEEADDPGIDHVHHRLKWAVELAIADQGER